MGFGSYDESEQANQDVDTDIDEEESVSTGEYTHEGEISFEFGDTSSDDLLDQFQQIKGE